MKFFFIILSSTLIFSCSHKTAKKEHTNYLDLVKVKKESLSKSEYRYFLSKEITSKEAQITSLESEQMQLSSQLSHNEVMSDFQSENVYTFKASTNKHRMHTVNKKIDIINSELLFLKSQLSSLDPLIRVK